ncbi:MAG: serine hydrolase [candidate division KSB1 bacterium]|nr:serine hydrolase [candidate division KSB1 bacterium]MDZ7364696.1 serine hydrolase [candidate division KSB1 bacterium]MDZ7402556.1 serine hydrolase [candidate division KSB1 bacterium]
MQQVIFFALALWFNAPFAGAQTSSAPKDLDAYVERVRREFEVPGIAVGIVKDGKVVVAKGYGVRKLGEPTPVDAKTLFGIASNTKAFTATALALLVEEGKIEWDAPVVRYLPWFQLADPYVTRELSVRDLLVHRSGLGLGAGDLLWWPPSTYNRKEIARRLRHLPLATSFRSAYAYDNVLYLIAGELIEEISGQTWEDFVAARILAKVGMTGSNVRHSEAVAGANVATPHAPIEGKVRPVAPFASDNTNPAGGINSNAEDMAKWMIVQLDSGRVAGGARLFSERTTRQLWALVTPMPIGNPAPELAALRSNFRGYALGFEVRDYRGRKVVAHTGGLPGYVSKVAMIPELKLGVTVLTNQESGAAFEAVTYRILDHYLGAAAYDWVAAYKKVQARADSMIAAAEQRSAAAREASSRPSLPLAKYAGTYNDAWYGNVIIRHDDGRLTIRFAATPSLVGDLEHYQYDTFIARWHDRELRADAFVTFALKPDGSIDQVKMQAVSPATDFSFDFHDLLLKPASRQSQ